MPNENEFNNLLSYPFMRATSRTRTTVLPILYYNFLVLQEPQPTNKKRGKISFRFLKSMPKMDDCQEN